MDRKRVLLLVAGLLVGTILSVLVYGRPESSLWLASGKDRRRPAHTKSRIVERYGGNTPSRCFLCFAILCADRGRDRIPLYFARMAARADQTGWSADFCDNRRNVICLVAYRYPCRFNPIPSCRSFVGSYL